MICGCDASRGENALPILSLDLRELSRCPRSLDDMHVRIAQFRCIRRDRMHDVFDLAAFVELRPRRPTDEKERACT
jgi:hypothetical protein